MDGFLLIDKPKGWTSFDAVAKVRSVLRKSQVEGRKVESQTKRTFRPSDFRPSTPSPKVKVGHTGTLDPLATGLLVLVIGKYTKKVPELSKADKTYEVEMKLGETSTTGDAEGVKSKVESRKVESRDVEAALKHCLGEVEQVPPAYSAVKVNGQRAYKLARAGEEVKIEPRKVKVYSLQMTDYSYPFVKITAKVSSGTYIRTLVEDIGKELGTGAYMSDLRRTEVGNFKLEGAVSPEGLTAEQIYNNLQTI